MTSTSPFSTKILLAGAISLSLFLTNLASNLSAVELPTNPRRADDKVQGSLVIIGGALRNDNAAVWQSIVKEAGGQGSKIAIIPSASANPQRAAEFAAAALNQHGADAFIVPLSTKYTDVDPSKAPHKIRKDPHWLEQIRQAKAVYFTGGDQAKITTALREDNGQPSPMLEAIWALYRHGGVIAGTSAGAAIMSTTMFNNAKGVLDTLKLGVKDGDEIADGLGFVGPQVFIDQHLIIRGRFARMLPVMLSKSYQLGLGIDENTALLVRQQNEVEIIGYKGAILFDLSNTTTNLNFTEFNLQNARISYLSHGDRFNIHTKQIKPAADKSRVDSVRSEDTDQAPTFHPNILANTAVVELMSQLMESSHQTAKGLAFSDHRGSKPQLGFEFTFTKMPDSSAYFSSITGSEAFTLIRLRLDVVPITMANQLYQAMPSQR